MLKVLEAESEQADQRVAEAEAARRAVIGRGVAAKIDLDLAIANIAAHLARSPAAS
jgi:hypothetical protein